MNFVLKMAWRDSRAARRRLLLAAFSIVLGIAALVAVGSLSLSAIGQVQGGGFHTWLLFRNPFMLLAGNVFFVDQA